MDTCDRSGISDLFPYPGQIRLGKCEGAFVNLQFFFCESIPVTAKGTLCGQSRKLPTEMIKYCPQ